MKQLRGCLALSLVILIALAAAAADVSARQTAPLDIAAVKTELWRGDGEALPTARPEIGQTGKTGAVNFGKTGKSDQGNAASPADQAEATRIAFQSYRDNNWEVYLARSDGDQAVRLANRAASDIRPRLNQGARQVAFAANRAGNLRYLKHSAGAIK